MTYEETKSALCIIAGWLSGAEHWICFSVCQKYFAAPAVVDVATCPLTEDYNHFYHYLELSKEQLSRIEPLAHDFHKRINAASTLILDRRNKLILEIKKSKPIRRRLRSIWRRRAVFCTGALEEQSAAESSKPDVLAMKKERDKRLNTAIQSLTINQRTAISLWRHENMSYKEIATIMGCSVSKLETLLFRAKKNLIELFKDNI